jgi:Sigma-54 interaction domain
MPVTRQDKSRIRELARLAYCNPFERERMELERQVLGDQYEDDSGMVWSRTGTMGVANRARANISAITKVATEMVEKVKHEFANGAGGAQGFTPEQLGDYWDVVTYVLLYRHIAEVAPGDFDQPKTVSRIWDRFLVDFREFSVVAGAEKAGIADPAHLFSCLAQVHRSFLSIYDFIIGESLPVIRLRAAIWESIFTSDLRRYRRVLFNRMGALPTLITGPSGTGKELVARAIGMSQYVAFDPAKKAFASAQTSRFHALNLSAMTETLVESELFGHRKGAFTGAVEDRVGWLEQCPASGAIFLDELGELNLALQVKLLRVVQQREFSRIGESTCRAFRGKLIGATNRDLDLEMQEGRFREDLYYRLCADQIRTPGLREQLDDRPEDLQPLVDEIAHRLAGEEARQFACEATAWIRSNLGNDYPWRGNFRELEQCVSSIMIRGSYIPRSVTRSLTGVPAGRPNWLDEIGAGNLSANDVLSRYCTWIFFRTGSYESAASLLGIDRRTVKAKVDEELLARFQGG